MLKLFGALVGLLTLVIILAIVPSAFADTVKVTITPKPAYCDYIEANTYYSPCKITIASGTTVEWTNADTISHTVTSGKYTDNETGTLFDSGIISKGKTWEHTFANTGTYDYFCHFHPGVMMGQVIVTAADSSTTGTPTVQNTTMSNIGTTSTPVETSQYITNTSTVSSPSDASSAQMSAWSAGIVIFSIVSGIGIWTAVRRR